MWRWPLGLLLAITLVLGIPSTVEADTSAEVTVTAMGFVCEAPGGFTVTYISDYEVGLSWAPGEGAENTMVRAAIGRMPEDRTDGYLVYYGDETSTTDWVNMELLSVPIYYRAWSENPGGTWEETGSTGEVEGITMMVIGAIFFAVCVTGLGFWQRKLWLFMACGLVWIGLGIYGFTDSDPGEMLYIIGWGAIVMGLVSFMSPLWFRERIESEPIIPADEAYERELDELTKGFRRRRRRKPIL